MHIRRRLLPPAMLLLLVALLFGSRHPRVVLAVSYPAGWNLVAGPTGSTLSGASGMLYTFQPGDTDYEAIPASTPLKSCYGYWAYFPNGGSITFGPGLPSCQIAIAPGQWALIGNPSVVNNATIAGATAVYAYTPGVGYQSATSLAPGQAAWVQGAGTVTVSAGAPTANQPPTPPPSPATSAPATNNPVSTLIGKTATNLCSYISDSNFTAHVDSAEWTKTKLGATAPGNGMWAILVVTVTNTGLKPDDALLLADLVDERGRTFKMVTSDDFPPYYDLRRQLGVAYLTDTIQPGLSKQVLWVYLVPGDVTSLRLVSHAPNCGPNGSSF